MTNRQLFWLMLSTLVDPFTGIRVELPEAKPLKKCALPGCQNMTQKAYCSADHCKEHKKVLKGKGFIA